ncbi:MAG TPA: hypothetical protein VIC55_02070 [Gemmatimonadaceae bacterium]
MRASFEIDDEQFDAPTGTFFFGRPGLKRTASGEEPGTTIIAVGDVPQTGAHSMAVDEQSVHPPPKRTGRVNECAVSSLRSWSAMRTRSRSTDEQLLTRLQAPPDLADGVQSLGYWHQRSRQLPWYQISARREAARMTIRWEQRVGAALVAQRAAPASILVSAGLLVARARLGRWTRRARIALVATATLALGLVAVPAAAALALLLHAL